MGKSNIEWLNGGKTWNPIRARNRETGKRGWYCQKVSKLCAHCYAETRNVNTFFGNGIPYAVDKLPQVELYLDEKVLEEPLHWKKPCLIFPCSMTDLFGEFVPFEWILSMYRVMVEAPRHTFLILTKRTQRRLAFLRDFMSGGLAGHKHIWEGSSVGTREEVLRDVPVLLNTPAALRWLSCEPLLERIDLRRFPILADLRGSGYEDALGAKTGINWVVTGGESGPKARPMHPDWPLSLQRQCESAGVPYFFKQWGEWSPTGPLSARQGYVCAECAQHGDFCRENVALHYNDTGHANRVQLMYRVGKKAAGRLLDGKEYSEYPEVRQ